MKPVALSFAIALATTRQVAAQVRPNADWRTIETEHFYVHFTPELEDVARRAAAQAESAYVKLSRHLTKPRGRIDLTISDDVDFSNGSATPYPSNRILVYANPPVFETALRFTDDPTELVVTHELAHVFHLDRVGGIWKLAQKVFGRSPYLFPNGLQPSWLVEGLAVYYETLLTGSGRIAGSEHRMIARSAALSNVLPRLDQLSLANPHFPYGYSAYAYGSLFVDHLAREKGDSAIRRFVESSARQLIPMWLDWPARRAFGKSFTRAFREWADSLVRGAPPTAPPMPGWRDLTVDGAYASFPRWLNDSTLVYTGTPGRETYGAYKLDVRSAGVRRERIGRRNSASPNSVLANGALLYSQLDYTSPYNVRSDLYVGGVRGGTRRLTRDARLAFPDARADGLIAAVQTLPAGTRIALVSANGRIVTPITSGGPDEQWSEPRWSPDGAHIAAIRWLRGGMSEVVVIDTTGAAARTIFRDRTVNAAPSWSPDGRFVYFSSDVGGSTNLYKARFDREPLTLSGVQRVSQAQTGLFEPQPSPGGREIAAVIFRADGYHVGVAPVDGESRAVDTTLAALSPGTQHATPAVRHPAPSSKYSPWRSLRPTHWMPFFESALDTNSLRIGVFTSGYDVVGRHRYDALFFVPTDNSGLTGFLAYRNATLGQPLLELSGSQDWENRTLIRDASQGNQVIGILRRRIRDATVSMVFSRPRSRTSSFLSVGGGVELRDYATSPEPVIDRIDSLYRKTYYYPTALVSLGWSNAQFPPLAISREDGFAISATERTRVRSGDGGTLTHSLVSSASAYKSLDFPGFAHHVVALRAAGGIQDSRGTGYFEVGGVNGGTIDVLPGYTLGEGRRTFGVRGFPAATALGIRALAGSAEYRAPFRLPGRGVGTLPVFLDRVSVTLFGDAGAAWCPGVFPTRPAPSSSLCSSGDFTGGFVFDEPRTIASAGGELNISAAILSWDAPFVYRLGFAVPVYGKEMSPGVKPTSYFTVGVSF